MNRTRHFFLPTLVAAMTAAGSGTSNARDAFSFEARLDAFNTSVATFRLRVENQSRNVRITSVELSVGNTDKHFDAASSFSLSGVASRNVVTPDENDGGGETDDRIIVNFSGFDSGDAASWYCDIDNNDEPDARRILFNNGDKPNAILSVTGSNGETVNIELPDGAAGQASYVFKGGATRRTLTVESVVEAAVDSGGNASKIYVNETSVVINPGAGVAALVPTSPGVFNVAVYDGDTVKITAPEVAYRDFMGKALTDSVLSDPEKIQADAEERFTAIGISVNNLAPTGDPTLYQFDVTEDTDAVVKWRHDYALRIESDFSETDSTDLDANGAPWAGPLTSQANGNPSPAAGTVHWIERDTPMVATLESSYVDAFRHPGLDIRFVPYAYIVSGASNTSTSKATDEKARADQTIAAALLTARNESPNAEYSATINGTVETLRKRRDFVVGQSPEPQHQLDAFTMYGPAEIRYIWKIQYGVSVAVDDPARQALPRITTPSDTVERTGSGVFWFDQDVPVLVGAAIAESADADAKALTGWISGDGYFFGSRGEINAADGTLSLGLPQEVDGNPVAVWSPTPTGLSGYRAMDIPRLRRPAKVLWTYGNGAVQTQVTVGEHVFQNDPVLAAVFRNPPTVKSTPPPGNLDLAEQGVWDPEAKKFYPLAGGAGGGTNVFRVDWVPDGGTAPIDVEITVHWPDPAHYPHVAGTPAVALDPDPNDDFLFKALKYSESSASVDDQKRFSAPSQGRSVLLFSNIQRNGRGQPREFLQVRVVQSLTLDDSIQNTASPVPVVIGEKVRDRMLDRAQLGTGYVVNSDSATTPTKARYNPFIYDPAKLIGLAAVNVYDTALLFSDAAQKRVANKSALPGPIIPVNLHPEAVANDLLRVIWYDDPAQNDGLLWPHAGRVYAPRWPVAQSFEDGALDAADDGDPDAAGRALDKLAGASAVAIDGQLAYVASATDDALTVIDIGDPTAFRLASASAADLGNFPKLGGAADVVVGGGLAFVAAADDDAVTVIDVSNPVLPQKLAEIVDGSGDFAALDGARALALSGPLLFVGAGNDNAITVVDVSNPESPQRVATITDGSGAFTGLGGVSGLAVSGSVLFVAAATDGALTLIDITDPGAPVHLATLTGLAGAADVVVDGGHAIVGGTAGVSLVAIGNPLAPVSVATVNASSQAVARLALDGDLLYTASSAGSAVFNVGDRGSPFLVEDFGRVASSVAVADGVMLVTGSTSDLAAFAVAGDRLGRIVIATQWGSESEDSAGRDQVVAAASGAFPRSTTFDPTRLQQAQVYNQPDRNAAGYNPNEEHAVMAPSLRYAQVSPRPLAAYALRDNDLNLYPGSGFPANVVTGAGETSYPFVLVQYFDVAEGEFRMNLYTVQKEQTDATGSAFATNYKFAAIPATPTVNTLKVQPFVRMEAGEPVIPFYPIGFVDGAVPCPNTYGTDLLTQKTYWEDHRGSNWAISGGDMAWFSVSPHYRMSPNFWWPTDAAGVAKSGRVTEGTKSTVNVSFMGLQVPFEVIPQKAARVETGDCVPFLPADVTTILGLADGATVNTVATPLQDSVEVGGIDVPVPATAGASLTTTTTAATMTLPTRILYKSDWPDIVPVLKAGETLTFSGGEFRADNPQMTIADFEGNLRTIDTPGLPQLTAFASAEVVFDSLNPDAVDGQWKTSWSARVAQVLDVRRLSLKVEEFPSVLQPANGKSRVAGGKYIFVDLPASLQKRIRYNPLAQFQENIAVVTTENPNPTPILVTRTGALEVSGLLNDKDIGNPTLTAAPPAVYVLEPNILTEDDVTALKALDGVADSDWDDKMDALAALTRNPNGLTSPADSAPFWVGLEGKVSRNTVTGEPNREPIEAGSTVTVPIKNKGVAAPERAFGPGLALLPNGDFMNPTGKLPGGAPYPDVSYVTVVENNDPSLGGSPITPHVIKIDRRERYRGSIKTVESDNVFDENLVLRHTGDFGTNADDLFFEWWYRPDDGSLNVPPPDLIPSGQTNPWKVFPDDSGKRGQGRFGITLKGNPNAPEVLIADTFWFVRYRHENELPDGTNWNKHEVVDGSTKTPVNRRINFTWAGAGNSQPFEDFDLDGLPDFRAQLAQGWIKRVLDAVNPYEARIRNFDGDNPATVTSMLQQFGPRFEGPVALNPSKNVIENVGLIELYETILKRGRDLTIDLSRPVASPAIANALQLASTRIADFYTVLGNEAYVDSLDPTIGIDGGSLTPSVFSFQNQVSDLLEEELGMLRGVDDYFARPVYNRMFWNFTKGEGEAAYALNYNISDINQDGFINEDDAMILYPQGHGDAWGHYLTALRNQYELLAHPFFNWVSRSEFYNLQDIVIKVDFLDERKFAQTAAAKAKAGAEIVNQTYRDRYVDDPEAQWQGYTDSNKDRAWGVQEWARRAGQGAYFDWVTANALLPAVHPNENLEGIQKVQRSTNSDIKVVSANLNAIQQTFDEANQGNNPLGLPRDAVVFDIDPAFLIIGSGIQGKLHFDQIYLRAVAALDSARSIWTNANEERNRLRDVANSELEFRNATFQEDLSYRNQLIKIFGKPYEGTVGPGQLYPAGYDGPDLGLYMYVNVREVTRDTVPGPSAAFAAFGSDGKLSSGALHDALGGTDDRAVAGIEDNDITDILDEDYASIFTSSFADATNTLNYDDTSNGLFSVDYTDLESPKVPLDGFQQALPVKAAGYTFQAPAAWGARPATGDLQILINQMVQQEAAVALAIGAWDSLQGAIVREARIISARLDSSGSIRQRNKEFQATKFVFDSIIQGLELALEINDTANQLVFDISKSAVTGIPTNLPIGGLAVGPGDALSAARSGIEIGKTGLAGALKSAETILKIGKLIEQIAFSAAELGVNFANDNDALTLNKKEWLKALEDLVGDEPIRRIAVFKEIEALRELSDQYRTLLDEGSRLVEERQAFNKRVAAQTQRGRYQDFTFRVSRNHALQTYRDAHDLAARYAYLAAKAYDYETNFGPGDPGSPSGVLADIVASRQIGNYTLDEGLGEAPQAGGGGLGGALAWLRTNFESQRGQLGINNPQLETGKMSLRSEMLRILPSDGGGDADAAWMQALQGAYVEDLWRVPEFRLHCRTFASERDAAGVHVPQPGLVLRFGTQIIAGRNFFGHPLGGGDHAFDPSNYATKINAAGVWFSDYNSDDLLSDLSVAPRVYLVPSGTDIMTIPTSGDSLSQRLWNVVDASIPIPLPATQSDLDSGQWVPALDGLNGGMGVARKFASFRAYHNGGDEIADDELAFDSRLVGRSVWNTEWLLILPGLTLNADADEGLRRFIDQVSDIKLVFQTYGYRGN